MQLDNMLGNNHGLCQKKKKKENDHFELSTE
jgi:hypothetical protein